MREIKIKQSVTNRNEESLHRYLNDISKISMIEPSEEILLARKIKAGDKSAEDKLVVANLRFVVSCAKKYQNLGLSLADLISEGNTGLIKAAGSFDETRGFKFISYAVWWVRQAIINSINEYARTVRIPMNQQLAMTAINVAAIKLEQRLQREPTLYELSEQIGKTEKQVTDHIISNARSRYLDDHIPGSESEDNALINFLPDQSGDMIIQSMRTEHLNQRLLVLISSLKKRDRLVLMYAFGLFGYQQLDNDDIALKIGLSKERIRQLINKSIQKLKSLPQIEELREYA